MRELIKGIKGLCKATASISAASVSLAKINQKVADKMAQTSGHPGSMEMVPLLHRFANMLGDMACAHDTLVDALTQSFIQPVEDFCARETEKAVEHEKLYNQGKQVFTEAMGKLLRGPLKPSSKSSPASALCTRALDVGLARRHMEQARHRLAQSVEAFEIRRSLELTDGMAAVLYAYQAHSRMLSESVAFPSSCLDGIRASQALGNQTLEGAQAEWQRRSEMLEMLLPVEVMERGLDTCDEAEFAQLSRVESALITPLSSPLLDLIDRRYGVFDVQHSLRTLYQPRQAPGVHHESYLHMQVRAKGLASTTASHVWIRRWFVLEGSSLYYVRESSHDPVGESMEGSERSLVCDVVLSSIREVPLLGHGTKSLGAGNATEAQTSSAVPYCLEIFSANRKRLILQAEGPKELRAWLEAFRRRLERLLVGGGGIPPCLSPSRSSASSSPERLGSKSPGVLGGNLSPLRIASGFSRIWHSPGAWARRDGAGAGGVGTGSGEGGEITGVGRGTVDSSLDVPDAYLSVAQDKEHYPPKILQDPALKTLTQQNPLCADCEAPHPDWVSLNLGVVVCLQCSGVHRSLGVHVSKIRSLALDDVDPVDLALVSRLGNTRVNQVYEYQFPDGWRKPRPHEDRSARAQYIKAKYVWKGFTCIVSDGVGSAAGDTNGGRSEIAKAIDLGVAGKAKDDKLGNSLMLVKAVMENNVEGALEALVQGADVDWTGGTENEKGRTPLHLAARQGDEVVEAVAFLVQNGANVGLRDRDDLTALDLATQGHHALTVQYLLKF
jgi:hypothetical protein